MTAKIIVTVLGLALILFVNWYFLFSRRKLRADESRAIPHQEQVKR